MPEPVPQLTRPSGAARLKALPLGGPALLSGELHPLLVKASGEVVRGWAQALGESFDADHTIALVDWLADAISSSANGHETPRNEDSSALARFLLDRIGSVLLGLLSSDRSVDRDEALALMRGVDIVRRSIEPNWDRYFASQLSGPDGLNLVVEVAHDIRSPLTSIRCLAETLERGQSGPVTELQRRQLRLIYSASLGLSSMASDVIEMARRGGQLVDGDPVPFSVAEVIEGVVGMVRPIAEEKGLLVRYDMPVTDQRNGMPIALSRVLLNLVTNALKFTDEGVVEVQCRAVSRSRIEFSVKDTGRGIPDEALVSLYQPFRRTTARADRSGFVFSGTGLGLAMCRKLLSGLSSELRYETKPDVGTRFYFELELPPVTHI